jgi:hypothetical protein
MADNDAFQDPVIQGAAKAAMAIEQMRDLERAGFDMKHFKDHTGREPTEDDIFNMHLRARAKNTTASARPIS